MKKKKWMSLLLGAALLFTAACGGGGTDGADGQASKPAPEQTREAVTEDTAPADTDAAAGTVDASQLEPVTLKFYFIGEPAKDNGLVFDEINRLLKEKINAEIEAVYLSWGDWDQRYPLLFTSGEEFDMIYTADWAMYSETASKGGFYPLTMEMLEKNCPLTVASLPEVAWSSSAINDQYYLIPQNNYFSNHYGFMLRGDLRKKYGMDEIKTVDQMEEFMDQVLENEPGMIPLDISRDNAEMYMRAIVVYPAEHWYLAGEHTGVYTYDFTDPEKLELTPFYELPGYEEHLERMVRWNRKGFLSKSDLTAANAERFDAGKSAVKICNITEANTAWQTAKLNHPDWEVEYMSLLDDKMLGSTGYSQGVAFNARSKNIDRAMMAADLLGYDPELNFLINSGLPGVHNEIVGTQEYEGKEFLKIKGIRPDDYGGHSYYCFSNMPSIPTESFEGYTETMLSYFFDQAAHHPLDGMAFLTDNVTTEVANTSNVLMEYLPVMYLGFEEDPKATLEEFKQKLKDAGIDAVNAEMKRQAQARFDAAKSAE
ncbi:MAG: DUF3502 domain-containing protein [Eubacteriales bacterium]|nr:DUF3502 domain-containing protein [Eubacteriales bacterium]